MQLKNLTLSIHKTFIETNVSRSKHSFLSIADLLKMTVTKEIIIPDDDCLIFIQRK